MTPLESIIDARSHYLDAFRGAFREARERDPQAHAEISAGGDHLITETILLRAGGEKWTSPDEAMNTTTTVTSLPPAFSEEPSLSARTPAPPPRPGRKRPWWKFW